MNRLILLSLAAATLFAGSATQSFTGVITDSMCVSNHATMHIAPDAKCVRDCVRGSVRFVLFDGKTAYKLSDQQTPLQFAAQRVKVTGTLFPKTGVIQVTKIESQK
jgi:hypothetical protein